MDVERFREYVLLYGADLQRWPQEIRRAGIEALEQSAACRAMQEDHVQFETLLRTRTHAAPSPGLESRIIAAALRRERMEFPGLTTLLRSCFSDLRIPAPVLMTAAALFLGVGIGLWLPVDSAEVELESAEVQAFLDSPPEAL